ncbi:sel1 repeat family protein [Dialister pneumosintes]|uniref:Sel1 repeat family protein n=2 Tax=Dialister pneumosintes TaxID=39950 RepID=A0ABX9MBP7_9FIRM|nr:sel1 repeat family protein [Dialister pneumosintes]
MAGGLYMMSKELAQAELLFKQFKHKEAYPIFQQLADAGDARAMYFMGIYSRLYLGVGHYNSKKSMEWFQKGMEKGDVLCAISLGYLQEEKKRDDFMKEWLPKAEELAAAGDVFAMDDIADCYFYGLGTSVDEKRGLESIDKAADAGYWLAAYDQATQYDDNGHRDTDYAKACAAYKEVSKLGYSEADYRLGFHYFQGIGVERDVKEAVRLWEKAWNLGNAAAANALGFVYSFDEKLKDDKKAFECFDKAAKAGLPLAAGNVGNCYFYGRGVKKSLSEAKKWYEVGAKAGLHSSMLQLGVILKTEGKNKEAFEVFCTAAIQGYPAAMGWVAACYEHGIGVEKSQEKVLFWLKRAAALGDQNAIANLQRLYPQNTLVKTNEELSDELPEEFMDMANNSTVN